MEAEMAMIDTGKYLCYDGILDYLDSFSGLLPCSKAQFLESKGYKRNLRFISQTLAAMSIRIVEELISEGELVGSGIELLQEANAE